MQKAKKTAASIPKKEKLIITRKALTGADQEKAEMLMKHYYLDIHELIRFLIRKDYERLNDKTLYG